MRVVPLPALPPKGKKASRRAAKTGPAKARRPRASADPAPVPAAKPQNPPADPVGNLACPRCHQGHLMTGKRGWGCSRWREGCKFVVWFEENGLRRSLEDLRAMLVSS